MATSGTYGTITLTLQQLLDAAFRACRLTPQQISSEMLTNARGVLQRMLNALPASVTPLWAKDHLCLPFTPGARAVVLPPGSIDVVLAKHRTYTTVDAVMADNLTSLDWALAPSLLLVGTYTLSLSVSSDGVTYREVWAPGAAAYTAGEPLWLNFDPFALDVAHVRLTGLPAADLTALRFATGYVEIEIERDIQEDFDDLPQTVIGPPRRFWLHRKARLPEMWLYPVPDEASAANAVLSVWRQRHIEDVGALRQTLEVPERWERAIIAMLAYDIAFDTPQVALDVVNLLKPRADEALMIIGADERDSSPVSFNYNLRGYTS